MLAGTCIECEADQFAIWGRGCAPIRSLTLTLSLAVGLYRRWRAMLLAAAAVAGSHRPPTRLLVLLVVLSIGGLLGSPWMVWAGNAALPASRRESGVTKHLSFSTGFSHASLMAVPNLTPVRML